MAGFKRQILAEQDQRLRPATLGELAEQGIGVFCWCNRCSHNGVLPVARLILELGPEMAVPEIGCALRCSRCGSKDIATRPDWPGLGQVTQHLSAPSPAPAPHQQEPHQQDPHQRAVGEDQENRQAQPFSQYDSAANAIEN